MVSICHGSEGGYIRLRLPECEGENTPYYPLEFGDDPTSVSSCLSSVLKLGG